MNHVNDAVIDLTRKVGKIGGQTMDNEEAQEWFRDGLAGVAQFRGQTTDLGEVLDEDFSGKHAGNMRAWRNLVNTDTNQALGGD
jgi:hypothetical protein